MRKWWFFILFGLAVLPALGQADYEQAIVKYRKKYKKDFLSDRRSPLKSKKQLKPLRFYAPDARYRINARFILTPETLPFDMPTSSGKVKTFVQYGSVVFELQNQICSLAVYKRIYSSPNPLANYEALFIPFKDLTSGKETYGGGRYLDVEVKSIQENMIELDFNKCYNPYCAYSSGYSCPIPPVENHLKIEITAGEKTPEMPSHE